MLTSALLSRINLSTLYTTYSCYSCLYYTLVLYCVLKTISVELQHFGNIMAQGI